MLVYESSLWTMCINCVGLQILIVHNVNGMWENRYKKNTSINAYHFLLVQSYLLLLKRFFLRRLLLNEGRTNATDSDAWIKGNPSCLPHPINLRKTYKQFHAFQVSDVQFSTSPDLHIPG